MILIVEYNMDNEELTQMNRMLEDLPTHKGDTGERGEKGDKGEPGLDGKDGTNGIDGKDGLNGVGKDGVDGKDGKDGSPDTPEQVRDKLEKLPEGKKLEIEAIEDLRKELDEAKKKGDSVRVMAANRYLYELLDVNVAGVTANQSIKWNGVSWVAYTPSGGGTPGGSNTQVQFNDAGAFGGDAGFTYNKTTDIATIGGLNLSGQSASELAIFDGSKNVISATTATYPSLTELSYLKGVTAAIQTQLDAIPTLASGFYTPTVSNEVNLDSPPTPTEAQYMRVGSVVTVSGRFNADVTFTNTPTLFEMTLPIASTFPDIFNVAGVAYDAALETIGAEIRGNTANNTAEIYFVPNLDSSIDPIDWSYTYTYRII